MLKQLKPALIIFLSMTVLTGIIYPLAITGIAQVIFPRQANGSLITSNGQVVGSTLIGQQFDDPKYFWGRLSATGDHPYNASASSGSNYGATNPALLTQVEARLKALHDATRPIPSPSPLTWSPPPAAGWTRISASPPPSTRPRASPVCAAFH